MKQLIRGSVVALFVISTTFSGGRASAYLGPVYFPPDGYLPGQLMCDRQRLDGYTIPTGTGACYLLYEDPSVDPYGSYQRTYKKYIGQAETLRAHKKMSPESFPTGYGAGTGVVHNGYYPTYAYGATMPCGTVVGDRTTGDVYISQPYDGYGDQGDEPGTFAYSDTYLFKVPSINTASLRAYIQPSRIVWMPKVTSDVPNLVNDGFSLPSCTIVKQQGTNDFYRLTGYVDEGGRHNIRKQYISNVDTLNMWFGWTPFYLEANISYYPRTRNAPLPPGLVVTSRSGGPIYFTDDLGYRNQVPSMAVLAAMGYGMENYTKDASGTWSLSSYSVYPGSLLKVSNAALVDTPQF